MLLLVIGIEDMEKDFGELPAEAGRSGRLEGEVAILLELLPALQQLRNSLLKSNFDIKIYFSNLEGQISGSI